MTVTDQLIAQRNILQAAVTDCQTGGTSILLPTGSSGGGTTAYNAEKQTQQLFSGMTGSDACSRAADELRLISGNIATLNERVSADVMTLNTKGIFDTVLDNFNQQMAQKTPGGGGFGLSDADQQSLEKGLTDLLGGLTKTLNPNQLTSGAGTGSGAKEDDTMTWILIGGGALMLIGILIMLIK